MLRIFTFLLLFVSSIYAHDLWIEKGKDFYILYYGHLRDNHHHKKAENKIIKYNPKIVKSVICIDKNGNNIKINVKKEYPFKVYGKCAILYIDTSTGYWTKTPYGTFNKEKNKVEIPIRSWLSYETLKRIDYWNKNLTKPFFEKLDVITLNNPLKLEKGDKLRLLITFNGKPAKNVAVSYDNKFRGITDEDGRINIRVKHTGIQIVKATLRKKVNSEKTDEIIYTTILNFEVKR